MQEIDNNGGDPVQDLAKELASRNRKAKEEAKQKEEEKTKAQKSVQDEIDGFHKRHSNITIKYLKDIGFLDQVDSPQYAGWSYAERVFDFIDKYNSAKKKSDDEKKNKVIEENSKKMTKVPSSNSNGGKTKDVVNLDPESKEDREAFMNYWNEKYGD